MRCGPLSHWLARPVENFMLFSTTDTRQRQRSLQRGNSVTTQLERGSPSAYSFPHNPSFRRINSRRTNTKKHLVKEASASKYFTMDDTEDIKKKIVKIYKRYKPEKVEEVDILLVKYAGQEKELLMRIKDKYLPSEWDNSNYNWNYNLKHFPEHQKAGESKGQKAVWYAESSLKSIQNLLEEHAKIFVGIIDIQNSK